MAKTTISHNHFCHEDDSSLYIEMKLKHRPEGKDFEQIHKLVGELQKMLDKYTTQRPKPHTKIEVASHGV